MGALLMWPTHRAYPAAVFFSTVSRRLSSQPARKSPSVVRALPTPRCSSNSCCAANSLAAAAVAKVRVRWWRLPSI